MNTQTSSGARRLRFFAAAVFAVFVSAAEASGPVSGVTVRQRYPWNGLVDISFSLSEDAIVTVSATDTGTGTVLPVATLSEGGEAVVNGQTGLATGEHKLVWNADTDVPNALHENVEVTVSADNSLYMIVKLTKENGRYPISYRAGPPVGGWPIEYKTKYLVLRKIKAGTFMMGSPTSEWGRGTNEDQHKVTISQSFYIGVFELTQGQGFLVAGISPTAPEYPIKYTEEDAASILNNLSSGTSLEFQLPTEAQWEYACRAGTSSSFYTGTSPSSKDEMVLEVAGFEAYPRTIMKSGYNAQVYCVGGHALVDWAIPVGSFSPSPWGLYDMGGNRREVCRDIYKANLGSTAVVDPCITSGSSQLVTKGGNLRGREDSTYRDDISSVRPAFRVGYKTYDSGDSSNGFRVVVTTSNN